MNEADLRCYHHPEREATSQCDRCGDYLCGECVHEHEDLHVCARCFEDIRPRDEIGMSAKIACVVSALAILSWPLIVLYAAAVSAYPGGITMKVSAVAVLLALSGMRGRASGERLFRWSVVASAGGNALYIAVFLSADDVISGTGWMLMAGSSLVLLLASVVLLRSSALKGAKPAWALAVALLAPLMFGACLLLFLVERYL